MTKINYQNIDITVKHYGSYIAFLYLLYVLVLFFAKVFIILPIPLLRMHTNAFFIAYKR